jgi:chitosanase
MHQFDHVSLADIIFENQAPSGVGDQTIDIGAMKQLGDQQLTLLAKG